MQKNAEKSAHLSENDFCVLFFVLGVRAASSVQENIIRAYKRKSFTTKKETLTTFLLFKHLIYGRFPPTAIHIFIFLVLNLRTQRYSGLKMMSIQPLMNYKIRHLHHLIIYVTMMQNEKLNTLLLLSRTNQCFYLLLVQNKLCLLSLCSFLYTLIRKICTNILLALFFR